MQNTKINEGRNMSKNKSLKVSQKQVRTKYYKESDRLYTLITLEVQIQFFSHKTQTGKLN
jgi:hypothetical protein